jgi:hypothetical protein
MIDAGKIEFPPEGTFFGGISGAPVFAMDDFSYPLVGIVSQSPATLPLIYVRSVAHLPNSFE